MSEVVPQAVTSSAPAVDLTRTAESASSSILRVHPQGLTTLSARHPSAMSGDAWIDTIVLREAARLRALRTEARLLGERASSPALEGVRAYIRRRDSGPAALIHGPRDQRRDLPSEEKDRLLQRLCFAPLPSESPRTLLIVAHQDDESIGAGARLCRIEDAMIVHVTNGAPRDPVFARRAGYACREDYEEARRQEAVRALQIAGVQPDQIVGLDVMDGEASFHLVELSLEIADLIDELQPEVVLTHPYEGGHTDHDATAFAVHLACGLLRRDGAASPAVLELTSYHTRRGVKTVGDFLPADGLPVCTVPLSPDEQMLKERMYACYVSQQRCLEPFLLDVERFRPAPRYVFTRPPHPGRLNYERYRKRRPMTGNEWRHHAGRALRALRAGRLLMQGADFSQPTLTFTNVQVGPVEAAPVAEVAREDAAAVAPLAEVAREDTAPVEAVAAEAGVCGAA